MDFNPKTRMRKVFIFRGDSGMFRDEAAKRSGPIDRLEFVDSGGVVGVVLQCIYSVSIRKSTRILPSLVICCM